MKRKLSDIEKQFVAEAEQNYFTVCYTAADGTPYAMGADHVGSLFTMEVDERPEPGSGGSIYTLAPRAKG